MRSERRDKWLVILLLGAWLLVVGWQVVEHQRIEAAGKTDLRSRSHEIAGALSAVTRALRFRGAVFQERLEPVLNELVNNRVSSVVKLLYVGLLNTDGDAVVAVGNTNLVSREMLASTELWMDEYATFVLPIEGASVNPEGATNNPTVVLPAFRFTNGPSHGRDFPHREPRPEDNPDNHPNDHPNESAGTNTLATNGDMEPPPPPPEGDHSRGNRRPPWMRGMSDAEFKALTAKRELHGLVLAMSTDNYRATCTRDIWLRFVISFFAGISALGAGLAWRNIGRTADLQIRLVRASEQNSHLKELSLAAAGLAHETRNPLNIIRGQAQLISRLPDASAEVRDKSKTIVDETDKVTAQLTEFINYSRSREVRRTRVVLETACQEIIRTLGHDVEEKKLHVTVTGEAAVEADEQLLRQVLFNLLINAIQAVAEQGIIEVRIQRTGTTDVTLEIRDNGPGVPPENRQDIFKPYFTTYQKGTGLGLAVVQQIVLAHGWEIVCLGNEPRGAVFRLTHLNVATA